MSRDRGSVVVLVAALLTLGALLAIGIGYLGRAADDRARAQTAADAAALAAADALALGRTSAGAAAAAGRIARANGGVLLTCVCGGGTAEVTVAVGPARAAARAEIALNGAKGAFFP